MGTRQAVWASPGLAGGGHFRPSLGSCPPLHSVSFKADSSPQSCQHPSPAPGSPCQPAAPAHTALVPTSPRWHCCISRLLPHPHPPALAILLPGSSVRRSGHPSPAVCICASFCSLCLVVRLSVHPPIISPPVGPSLSPWVCPSGLFSSSHICLSICLFVRPCRPSFIYLPTLSFIVSVRLSIYLSVCSYIPLFIHPAVHPPIRSCLLACSLVAPSACVWGSPAGLWGVGPWHWWGPHPSWTAGPSRCSAAKGRCARRSCMRSRATSSQPGSSSSPRSAATAPISSGEAPEPLPWQSSSAYPTYCIPCPVSLPMCHPFPAPNLHPPSPPP